MIGHPLQLAHYHFSSPSHLGAGTCRSIEGRVQAFTISFMPHGLYLVRVIVNGEKGNSHRLDTRAGDLSSGFGEFSALKRSTQSAPFLSSLKQRVKLAAARGTQIQVPPGKDFWHWS